jgi:hypothetical protein
MKIETVWHNPEEYFRRIAQVINQNDEGNIAVNAVCTLTANSATTVVKNRRVGKDSVILFMPKTANAAAEQAAGGMYVSAIAPRSQQFTITHANNAQTDRTFSYITIGQTLNAN